MTGAKEMHMEQRERDVWEEMRKEMDDFFQYLDGIID